MPSKVDYDVATRTLRLRPDEACLVANDKSFAILPTALAQDAVVSANGADATIAVLAFIIEEPAYADIRKLAMEQLLELGNRARESVD